MPAVLEANCRLCSIVQDQKLQTQLFRDLKCVRRNITERLYHRDVHYKKSEFVIQKRMKVSKCLYSIKCLALSNFRNEYSARWHIIDSDQQFVLNKRKVSNQQIFHWH